MEEASFPLNNPYDAHTQGNDSSTDVPGYSTVTWDGPNDIQSQISTEFDHSTRPDASYNDLNASDSGEYPPQSGSHCYQPNIQTPVVNMVNNTDQPKARQQNLPNRASNMQSSPKSGAYATPKYPANRTSAPSTAQERTKMLSKRSKTRLTQARHPQQSQASAPVPTNQPDSYTLWYQMLTQYYSQLYPGYSAQQIPTSGASKQTNMKFAHSNRNSQQRGVSNSVLPQKPLIITQPQAPPMLPSAFDPQRALDYAYYYQYYYGAAAPNQLWSSGIPNFDQLGRRTPKLFHTPHIKAWLSNPGILVQVLPNRPSDGELPLIELISMSDLAQQAVAEATRRVSEVETLAEMSRFQDLSITREGISGEASGMESPDHLSSFQDGRAGDEDAEEARAYNAIALAWDRSEHTFYPGPLDRSTTLKADVLAFLREKLTEFQDRTPIDWDSAALLITYLEWLVKNNGVIQPSDLASLLLADHMPQSESFHNNVYPVQDPTYVHRTMNLRDSFSSLPPSEPSSGRQSPYAMVGSDIVPNPRSRDKAASECGAYIGTTNSLMQAGGRRLRVERKSEYEILDRFRQRLMHGTPMQALEYACGKRLWGHAFALAHYFSPTVFECVMKKFLTSIDPTDPILTYYQMAAGEVPRSVTNAAYERGSDNGEWRPHLAMILATASDRPELTRAALERLGDGLLSRRLVYAAHLCYLLMGPLYDQTVYRLPDKIWLIGVHSKKDRMEADAILTATTEAIQLTEIYEYTMQLANKHYRLPQLLPFKLVYATRLIDAGLLNKARRYLASIGSELLLEANSTDFRSSPNSHPVFYSLVDNCLRLAEPLQGHPDLEELEAATYMFGHREPERNAAWLDDLRQLWHDMNTAMGRPSYNRVNWELPAETQLTSSSGPAQHGASVGQLLAQPPEYSNPPQTSHVHGGQGARLQDSSFIPAQHHTQSNEHPVMTQQKPTLGFCPSQSVTNRPRGEYPSVTAVSATNITQQDDGSQSYHRRPPTRDTELRRQTSAASGYVTPTASSSPGPMPHQATFHFSTHDAKPQPQPTMTAGSQFPDPGIHTIGVTDSTNSDSNMAGSQSFFVPKPSPPGDQPDVPQPYDYFSGSQYQPLEMMGNRSRTVSGCSHASHGNPYNPSTPTPQTPRSRNSSGAHTARRDSGASLDQRNTPNRQPYLPVKPVGDANVPGRIKEEPPSDEVKSQPMEDESSQQTKNTWFSGWLGKIKRSGPTNVHLPDDKNPSIIWNDQLKQWIDITKPEGSNSSVPPPPPMMPVSSSPNVDPMTTYAGRSTNRSRYVNVLANQAYGSAALKAEGPIQPPLPPSVYSPPMMNEHQN